MVVGEHHEGLLAADEPRRLAMAEPLGGLRQGEAELAQRLERVLGHLSEFWHRKPACPAKPCKPSSSEDNRAEPPYENPRHPPCSSAERNGRFRVLWQPELPDRLRAVPFSAC